MTLPFDPLRFAKPHHIVKSREQEIAERAYLRAKERGFEPGHEVEDWLLAEAEVDARRR
jgi:hypothetical protein